MKHKAKLTKIGGLLLAVVMLISALSACGTAPAEDPSETSGVPSGSTQEKDDPTVLAIETPACGGDEPVMSTGDKLYSIHYDLDTAASCFTGTPSEAKAGETVEIKTEILLDADIHVYVDGQEIGKTHYDSDYWGYSFIMPDKDVLITAKFYTKGEVWGIESMDLTALKEQYPEYFGLPTGKGLEVYVWQMAPNSYSFGVMGGTNRVKTQDELWNLKGVSADKMRIILSSYNIDKDDIFIIPLQHPLSSYIAEIWIREKDEDTESVAKRQQEYIDKIREMLFGTSAATKGSILLQEGTVNKISVTSLPEGYAYSFDGEAVKRIVDYISELDLIADFPENPDEYGGMTWVIDLGYESGNVLTIYHFGNMFIRANDGPWYKMTYEEASRFGSLLNEQSN